MAVRSLLNPGELIAGKYRVRRALGQGGMGVVLIATDTQLQREVAVKLLLPDQAENPQAVQRFVREARSAAKLTSEHTIRIHDVGELPNGVPYMVMERLVGSDLSSVLATRGRMPVAEAVDCILQACEAIAEAHAHRIVHRDIKPANLFLTRRPDGRSLVKVLDFGLAKSPLALGEAKLTESQAVMGSPHYMSPEQLRASTDVDHRADIWALGVSLYQLLTGRVPFDAPGVPDVIARIMRDTPTEAGSLLGDLPHGLSEAITRCLQKQREKRFGSVAELALAIEPFGSAGSHGAALRIENVLDTTHTTTRSDAPPRDDAASTATTAPRVPVLVDALAATVQAPGGLETKTEAIFDSGPTRAATRKMLWAAIVFGVIGGGVIASVWAGWAVRSRPAAAKHEELAPPPSASAPSPAAAPQQPQAVALTSTPPTTPTPTPTPVPPPTASSASPNPNLAARTTPTTATTKTARPPKAAPTTPAPPSPTPAPTTSIDPRLRYP